MGIRITWKDNNLAEDGHRLYRATVPMDPNNLPEPLVELGPDVEEYEDGDGITPGETYYYRIGAVTAGGVERVSEELVVDAVGATAPVDGLFLHYTMDNISGSTLVDETGNANGTISGAAQTGGVLGQALDLTGGNHTVDCGRILALEAFTALTVSLWVYPTGTPDAYSALIGNLRGTSPISQRYRGFALQQLDASTVRWFGFGDDVSVTATVTPDTWVHLACVWDGANLLLYKNGALAGVLALSINRIDSGEKLWLGRLPYVELYASALIDQVRVYDRALAEWEIQQLFAEA